MHLLFLTSVSTVGLSERGLNLHVLHVAVRQNAMFCVEFFFKVSRLEPQFEMKLFSVHLLFFIQFDGLSVHSCFTCSQFTQLRFPVYSVHPVHVLFCIFR